MASNDPVINVKVLIQPPSTAPAHKEKRTPLQNSQTIGTFGEPGSTVLVYPSVYPKHETPFLPYLMLFLGKIYIDRDSKNMRRGVRLTRNEVRLCTMILRCALLPEQGRGALFGERKKGATLDLPRWVIRLIHVC